MVNAYFYSNTAVETTLSGSISAGALSITVGSVTGFPVSYPYVLSLDFAAAGEELVTITNAAGTTLTIGTRGFGGTSAQSHSVGARVAHTYNAVDATDFRTHEQASTAVHGVTGAVVGTTDVQTLTSKTLTTPVINNPTVTTGTFTTPAITNPAVTTGTFANPAITDANHGNSAIGLTPMFTNAIAGTTADLESVQLNSSLRRKLTALGRSEIRPQSGAAGGYLANAASGYTGNVIEVQVNSVSKYTVDHAGYVSSGGWTVLGTGTNVDINGNITFGGTLVSGSASLNGYAGIGGTTAAMKSTDTVRASTITRTADPHLSVLLTTGFTYILEGYLSFDGTGTEDFAMDWSFPASTTMRWSAWAQGLGTASQTGSVYTGSNDQTVAVGLGTVGPGLPVTALITGQVFVGGAGGTLALRWAQSVSGANNTTLQRGSWIRITRAI